MNTREVGLLLMVVWLVLLWGSINLSKRWRRSGCDRLPLRKLRGHLYRFGCHDGEYMVGG